MGKSMVKWKAVLNRPETNRVLLNRTDVLEVKKWIDSAKARGKRTFGIGMIVVNSFEEYLNKVEDSELYENGVQWMPYVIKWAMRDQSFFSTQQVYFYQV